MPETILDDAIEDYNRSKIALVRLENATQVSISYMLYFISLLFTIFHFIAQHKTQISIGSLYCKWLPERITAYTRDREHPG